MGRIAELDRGDKVQIGHLMPHHRSMARTMVTRGLKPGELAILYNMKPAQVSIITNSPLFKAEVARLEAMVENEMIDTSLELASLKGRSVEVLAEELHRDGDSLEERRLRKATAIDVLDRTGHPKGASEQKHLHLHGHVHKNYEEMSDAELYNEVMGLTEGGDEGT